MDDKIIFSHIDHTLLKADASREEIEILCDEAFVYGAATACIPPSYIKRARVHYPQLKICTVIGFPFGYNTTKTKVFEALNSIDYGADEIDMVINLGHIKNKQLKLAMQEIIEVKKVIGKYILKVIIETCYLNQIEKIAICSHFLETGADFLKTSTGFGSGGAKLKDIILFRRYLPENIKLKAAGGIRTKKEMVDFINAGCERIGCSSAMKVLSLSK